MKIAKIVNSWKLKPSFREIKIVKTIILSKKSSGICLLEKQNDFLLAPSSPEQFLKNSPGTA